MKPTRNLIILLVLVVVLIACQSMGTEVVETIAPERVPTDTQVVEAIPTETADAPPSTPTATPEPTATPLKTPVPTFPAPPEDARRWWDDTVFYEVFVRSFYDSDGDGIGDLNGLIEKLDYLNDGDPNTTDDLGVTGIWLMPITDSPSYHGYDVTDYYNVDPEYGTNQDFIRLVEEAHQRGIYVIVDLVMNHTSRQHPWFVASKADDPAFRDWYIWVSKHPGYLGPWNQTVWSQTGGRYYYSVFWSGMPDLNLHNPEVTDELFEIVQFWLEELNTDGFRLDAIKHLIEDGAVQENTAATHEWLQEFYNFYKNVDPDAFTVGEAWTSTAEVLDYTGDEVDIAFAFDLSEAFLSAASGPANSTVVTEMTSVVENYPPGQYATFLANHDQDRIMSQVRDEQVVKLAATMLLTSPGVPFLYYGEEIGMTGTKPDEDIRRPMQWHGDDAGVGFTSGDPWRAPASDYSEVNVATQMDNPESLLSHYRSLIQLRNQHQALRIGEWVLVDAGTPNIYAYLRHTSDDYILILMNLNVHDMAAGDYALTLETGPLDGVSEAISLLGLENPAAPQVSAAGGFSNYIPFDIIPAQSFAVIQLTP